MTTQPIKDVLDSGECSVCKAAIITDDTMRKYFCENDPTHFLLEIEFHGGESITAKLNGKPVDQAELDQLDW